MSSNTPTTTTTNSYGRRTWNEQEYADKARQEKRDRYNAHHSKHNNLENNSTTAREFFNARNEQLSQIDNFSKISFVSTLNDKNAGFYCEVCNRRFKDNLKFIDHLNSKEHIVKSGFDGDNAGLGGANKFTLQDVIDRLEVLKQKKG
ncbi:unnamed protein product [Ambrosiozyma monospora]|uniref:Unnamed protein product n=1 Tax=Ambrosiozyma monospora TaxID=43982 RepID=A0ACB5UB47_AMBMO|nr:unnamed protein product [Ambrosiozyma monospora]